MDHFLHACQQRCFAARIFHVYRRFQGGTAPQKLRALVLCFFCIFMLLGAVLQAAERPWGKSFAPRSPRTAKNILVVPMKVMSEAEKMAICCLQALIARKEPTLWLERESSDAGWLDWHKKKGWIDSWKRVKDPTDLYRKYATVYKGAIIADEEMFRGRVLALNVAACEDLILVTEDLAKKLKIPVKIDLRGRFTTYAEGLRWVWKTYGDRLNPYLCDFREPNLAARGTFDVAFQWRGLMFWLPGKSERHLQGVDYASEMKVIKDIMSQMKPTGVCLGFPGGASGRGTGIGEPPGVKLLSEYGLSLVCTNHRSNFSILNGMPILKWPKRQALRAPKLDKSKIYVALVLSDGDNEILWPEFFRTYFDHKSFGSFPLAFGIGPAMQEMQPGVLSWYYEHAKPGTEFISDVSGAGYMHPDEFAANLKDKNAVWDDYLGHTRRLMATMNLKSIRTVGGDDNAIRRFAAGLPLTHSIFADMGRYSGKSGIKNLTYSLDGKPVFRSVTSWRYGKEGFIREIREQVGNVRPAFVNGFVHCWTFKPEDLPRIVNQAGDDIVFVTPSQLAALYGKHEKMSNK